MSEPVLTFLKFCLVALLYLFLLRVVLVVAKELRGTPAQAPLAPPAPAPTRLSRRKTWRLVLVEPEAESGAAFDIDGEATIGRGGGCRVPLAYDTFVSAVHARAVERRRSGARAEPLRAAILRSPMRRALRCRADEALWPSTRPTRSCSACFRERPS